MCHFSLPRFLFLLALAAAMATTAAAQNPKERAVLKGHHDSANHLAFSPDGKLLASCGEPSVKVWSVATGKVVATFESPEDARWGRAVAFSPDGKMLVFSWDDETIQLANPTRADAVTTLELKGSGTSPLAISGDGRVLAVGSTSSTGGNDSPDGTTIQLWDMAARRELGVLNGHKKSIFSIGISQDGKTLASAAGDRTVRLWDLKTRRERALLTGHTGPVWAVAISPDSKLVASGGGDGAINLWDIATGELLDCSMGHGGRVTALAFTPDGQTIASTAADRVLRLWDTASRRLRCALRVRGGTVRGVAFTPDGRIMATGNSDGIIRLWDMPQFESKTNPRPDDATQQGIRAREEPVPRDPSFKRETLKGGIAHSPEDYLRITGRPEVIDGNTIAFEDGVEIDISGGMDAPALAQQGLRNGSFYPCGQEAAAFLRKLIGTKAVTCYVNTKHGMKGGRDGRMHGTCYLDEVRVDELMIVHGWAVADHSSTVALELMARENKRGLWQGQFLAPKYWRKGERLQGEPAAPTVPKDKAIELAEPEPAKSAHPPVVVKDGDRLVKITGLVQVLDAHTLRYADGTELELNGGMDAPDLEQAASMNGALYPWGTEAADFLRKLIGDRPVTCYLEGSRGAKLRGACFVGETSLEIEMVRNGWAVSHHTALDGWSNIASENRRGIWRGEFIAPENWQKGDRLPGEAGETNAQRKAVAALHAFEPIITYEETKPGRPVIAVQFRPNSAAKAGDGQLAYLRAFSNLRALDIPSSPNLTDAGLAHLGELRQLVELNVNWTNVTPAGVRKLTRRMTHRLEVAGVKFGDHDLAVLDGMPYLKVLSLRSTEITDKGLEHLRSLDQLRWLSLMSTKIGDAGLRQLGSLVSLEDLDLDRTAITDAGLAHLKGLKQLRRLQIAHTAVTDAGLSQLAGLPMLEKPSISGFGASK
jgi:endonuclease YncB( thermonuclease family)